MFLLLQIKRLKDLEKEKDALWSGLEVLETARLWYRQRLQENRARQDDVEAQSRLGSCQEGAAEVQSGARVDTSFRFTTLHYNATSVPVWVAKKRTNIPQYLQTVT